MVKTATRDHSPKIPRLASNTSMQFDRLSGVAKNRQLARFKCESFRYFGGKAAIKVGRAKSIIDIVEGLEGSGRHAHCSQKPGAFAYGPQHVLFRW